jgi:hypothetical protein
LARQRFRQVLEKLLAQSLPYLHERYPEAWRDPA